MTAQDKLKLLYAYMAGCAHGGWYEAWRLGRPDRQVDLLPELAQQMLELYRRTGHLNEEEAQAALNHAIESIEAVRPDALQEIKSML